MGAKNFIQIASVAKKIREYGRFETSKTNELIPFLNLIKGFNLNYKIFKSNSKAFFVYFSKKHNNFDKLIDLHHKNKNKNLKEFSRTNTTLGKMYGYPSCCINFFSENGRNIINQNDFPLIKETIKNTVKEKQNNFLPLYTNIFSVNSLIFHIPHSFYCNHSINLAKNQLQLLQKIQNIKYKKVVNSLKKAIVFQENRLLVKDYTLSGGFVVIDKIKFKINEIRKKNMFLFG